MQRIRQSSPGADGTYHYGGLSALVIEEDPFFRRLVATMLEEIGLGRVSIGLDGSGCDSDPEPTPADMVFIALPMLRLDPARVLDSVRPGPHPSDAAAVVFMAADAEQRRADFIDGACLVKPFSAVQVRNRIDALIRSSPHLRRRAERGD